MRLCDACTAQPAHNGLGLMYMGGQGVEANATKAAEHFQLAIEAGVVSAHNNMGILYINVRSCDGVHAVVGWRLAVGACTRCHTPS